MTRRESAIAVQRSNAVDNHNSNNNGDQKDQKDVIVDIVPDSTTSSSTSSSELDDALQSATSPIHQRMLLAKTTENVNNRRSMGSMARFSVGPRNSTVSPAMAFPSTLQAPEHHDDM